VRRPVDEWHLHLERIAAEATSDEVKVEAFSK
jgi:hypothetical protein